MIIRFDKLWFFILYNEFKRPYFKNIFKVISFTKKQKIIYPTYNNIFKALKLTKFNTVAVVIVGQDPYCEPNQADGLAFSAQYTDIIPPSLKNIYTELNNDIGINMTNNNGNLIPWAKQGIFLLNSILTTEQNKPAAHVNIGWETFTDKLIKALSDNKRQIIFVLLGQYALTKLKIINVKKHIIITAAHPSIKSANKGFFESRIFSKINLHLKLLGVKMINWQA
ncbi:MAG TPA: uracil-DNA glycosylase [Candidatus Azoamicus sp. OHIO2]